MSSVTRIIAGCASLRSFAYVAARPQRQVRRCRTIEIPSADRVMMRTCNRRSRKRMRHAVENHPAQCRFQPEPRRGGLLDDSQALIAHANQILTDVANTAESRAPKVAAT